MFGDVFLGQEFLTSTGLMWRKLSVATFILLLAWGAVYLYFSDKAWVCPYGLRP